MEESVDNGRTHYYGDGCKPPHVPPKMAADTREYRDPDYVSIQTKQTDVAYNLLRMQQQLVLTDLEMIEAVNEWLAKKLKHMIINERGES